LVSEARDKRRLEKTAQRGASRCVLLFSKCYLADQIKDEMGEACGTYGVKETCIQGFVEEI